MTTENMPSNEDLELFEHLKNRPFLTDKDLSISGKIKSEPADFVANEVPLYEPSGEGQHLYVYVEKTNITTPQMIRELADYFHIPERDIGVAGMKDKVAVTRQWVSLPLQLLFIDHSTDVIGPVVAGIKILDAKLHNNKLRTGHLKQNNFELIIRDLGTDVEKVVPVVEKLLKTLGGNRNPKLLRDATFWSRREHYSSRPRPTCRPPFKTPTCHAGQETSV